MIEALRANVSGVARPAHDDICYATQNRQDAVRRLGQQCDLVLVVGSPNSSNSNRLRELAEKQGVPAHLIDGADDIDRDWLAGKRRIGVTAGASAPESLVQGVVARLREWGAGDRARTRWRCGKRDVCAAEGIARSACRLSERVGLALCLELLPLDTLTANPQASDRCTMLVDTQPCR